MKANTESLHNWKCSDVPGHYICYCGTTGIWNRDLQKIEVLEPIPYDIYLKRHTS